MLSRETIAKIQELRQKGFSKKAIAKALNIDVKTVRKHLSDMPESPFIVSSNPQPTSVELRKKKQRLAEIKTDTDLLKAESEYKRQKTTSDFEEMELALQENTKTKKEKEVQIKYGEFYLNQWLEEAGFIENYDNSTIEEIKNIVKNNLSHCFLEGMFEDKEALEDYIRQFLEEADQHIGNKQREELERHIEEELQRKNQQRDYISTNLMTVNTLRKVLKKW